MIKHRRLSKKTAAAVLASAILIGTSTTAFAYVDPGAEQTAQSQTSETAPDDSGQEAAPDEGTSEGDTVLEETDETGTAFLPRAMHRFRMISRRILRRNF